MAWHQPGDKPLSEPMMVSLLKHICVTQPQRVKQVMLSKKLWHSCSYDKYISENIQKILITVLHIEIVP